MVDRYKPLIHEVNATARMGAHPAGEYVLARDYDALAAALAIYKGREEGKQLVINQLEGALISARNDIREAIPVTKHEYTLRRLRMGEATITAALTALEPPVSALCAVCDQIKELHPNTHPWTAKVAVAETPVAHSKSQQRRFETMGVEHVPYTKETSLSPTSPSADHLDSSSCGESSAGTGGHSSAETGGGK